MSKVIWGTSPEDIKAVFEILGNALDKEPSELPEYERKRIAQLWIYLHGVTHTQALRFDATNVRRTSLD
jgi:hypothetical protein